MERVDRPRLGRMPRWQRWTTWLVVGACLVTGLVYLVAMDFVAVEPRTLNVWWIAHGASSLCAMVVVGGAGSAHALIAWRARRGRWTGAVNAASLVLLIGTAVLLFYGLQAWRGPAALVHSVVGVVAFVAFPAHVWWGRTRRARG